MILLLRRIDLFELGVVGSIACLWQIFQPFNEDLHLLLYGADVGAGPQAIR